jgi:hypothetical protein
LFSCIFRLSVVYNGKEFGYQAGKIFNGSNSKASIAGSLNYLTKPRFPRYVYCKEIFISIPVVIYMRKDFYLWEMINKRISELNAAGLIDYWHLQSIRKKTETKKSTQPKILTLKRVNGSFQLLLGGLCISFLIFFVEAVIKFR